MVFIAECTKCNSFKIFSIIYTRSFTRARQRLHSWNVQSLKCFFLIIGNGYWLLSVNYPRTYTHTHILAHTHIRSHRKKKKENLLKKCPLRIWKSMNKIIYIKSCRLGPKTIFLYHTKRTQQNRPIPITWSKNNLLNMRIH